MANPDLRSSEKYFKLTAEEFFLNFQCKIEIAFFNVCKALFAAKENQ
jgi:hypothetical protein